MFCQAPGVCVPGGIRADASDYLEHFCAKCWISRMAGELRTITLWRGVISECLATFFLVFLATLSTLNWDLDVYQVGTSSCEVIYVSITFGLAVACLTECFGHVSGGHLNPAVSLAMVVNRRVSLIRGVLYIAAQCGGGIAGTALLYSFTPEDYRGDLGVTSLHHDLTPIQGLAIELILTFIYVLTFVATTDPKRRNQSHQALYIGMVVTFTHLVGRRLTGCACNPARSLGPAFLKNFWDYHWIYWAGPLGGGIIASLLYEYIFDPSRGKKGVSQMLRGFRRPEPSTDQIPATPIYRSSRISSTYTGAATWPTTSGTENTGYEAANIVRNAATCDSESLIS